MKLHHPQSHGPRSGVAMVLAISVLAVLMTASYVFFHVAMSSSRRSKAEFDDRRAFLLAEAGLHEAYEAVRNDGTGGIGTMADPAALGGGVLWVDATDLGANQTHLLVTAMIGGGRHAMETVVEWIPDKSPLFETTLNSDETLTLNSAVVIDSFDSALGTYASQATNVTNGFTHAAMNGDARSNSDIIVNANAQVFGDAVPGPGGSVSLSTGAYVSGTTTPSVDPFKFPPITVPTFPASGGFSVPPNGTATLPAGEYELPSLTINKSATLIVKGPSTIVVDDFSGGKDANLLVDATLGPVTIHVRRSYSHISGFEADALPGSPMALAFMIQGTSDIVFPASTAIRGAYYVPDAAIVFSSANECWGAFAGKRINMSNNMRFHFDEDLLNHWESKNGPSTGTFRILGWADTAVQPQRLLADRRDPIAVLGLKRASLRPPAMAWEAKVP